MDRLATETLICIFRYVSIIDRARLRSICRRWRNICDCDQLWNSLELDVTDFGSISQFKLFLKNKCCIKVRRLRINDSFVKRKRLKRFDAFTISSMKLVCSNFKSLKELQLINVNLASSGISFTNLPTSVQFLALRNSNLPTKFFENISKSKLSSNLEVLDLTHSGVKKDDIALICVNCCNLVKLIVVDCFRISAQCLLTINEALAKRSRRHRLTMILREDAKFLIPTNDTAMLKTYKWKKNNYADGLVNKWLCTNL